MERILEYYQDLPPTIHMVLAGLGAFVIATKFLSSLQFFLGLFVFSGKNVSQLIGFRSPPSSILTPLAYS